MLSMTRISNLQIFKRTLTVLVSSAIIMGLTGASASPALALISAAPGKAVSMRQVNNAVQQNVETNNTSSNTTSSNTFGTAYYFNWSGYAANGSTPFNEVKTSYVQPVVSCPVTGADTLFWVGFDGFSNGTVEQAGTGAMCGNAGSKPTYFAWWEMYPTNSVQFMPITINPGDSIDASVIYSSASNLYTMSVRDLTRGVAYSANSACATGLYCARQTAEWIVERPTSGGQYTPLANWVAMKLTNDKASDTSVIVTKKHISEPYLVKASTFALTGIDMVNYPDTGKVLASVGPMTKTVPNHFVDTWQAAQ